MKQLIEVDVPKDFVSVRSIFINVGDSPEFGAKQVEAKHIRTVTASQEAEPVGEVIEFVECKEVSWRKGKMPPTGTKLYTYAPTEQSATQEAEPKPWSDAEKQAPSNAMEIVALREVVGDLMRARVFHMSCQDGCVKKCMCISCAEHRASLLLSRPAPKQPTEQPAESVKLSR